MIEQILKEYIDNMPDYDRSEHWHISGTFSCCRKRYMQRLPREYAPVPFDDRTRRVFFVGHRFHDIIQKALLSRRPGSMAEIKVVKGDIAGSADLILRLDDGKHFLCDIKSVHSKKFDYLNNGQVDKHYWGQVCWYNRLLKDPEVLREIKDISIPKIDGMFILYVSKDDLLMKEVGVVETPELGKEMDGELEDLRQSLEARQIPAENFTWECCTVGKTKEKKITRPCPFMKYCPNILAEIGK